MFQPPKSLVENERYQEFVRFGFVPYEPNQILDNEYVCILSYWIRKDGKKWFCIHVKVWDCSGVPDLQSVIGNFGFSFHCQFQNTSSGGWNLQSLSGDLHVNEIVNNFVIAATSLNAGSYD